MRTAGPCPDAGISLVEVVVALVLFSVLALGALQLLLHATLLSSRTELHGALLWHGAAVADSLEGAGGSGWSGGPLLLPGGGVLEWVSGTGGVGLLEHPDSTPWVVLPVPPAGPDAAVRAW
jgi:prepilin-type N-terminal cleavage/methylation domain-containing protein